MAVFKAAPSSILCPPCQLCCCPSLVAVSHLDVAALLRLSSNRSRPTLRLRSTLLPELKKRCRILQGRVPSPAIACSGTAGDGSGDSEPPESSSKASSKTESFTRDGSILSGYGLISGLAALGVAETGYLTLMKLSGASVSCPLGGGSCNDVLNSEYSTVFGIPLAVLGLVAYGTVSLLGFLKMTDTSVRIKGIDLLCWLLLGTTGAMASASAYFIYILLTKLEGASCAYCVASAFLSLSLLLLTLRVRGSFFPASIGTWNENKFTSKDLKQVAGLQLAVTASVLVALSTAYGGVDLALARSSDIDLPPVEPEVTTVSSSLKVSLAKHLQSVGAKMYGAFWCSHCFEQKQMFGREAVKYLDYVECYPDGYRRGVQIAKACEEASIQGFPTWIIKGEVLSGERDLPELARVSGYDGFDISK